MPVTIEEITAEVEAPPANPGPPAQAGDGPHPAPERELRRQREVLDRLAIRSARLRAD